MYPLRYEADTNPSRSVVVIHGLTDGGVLYGLWYNLTKGGN